MTAATWELPSELEELANDVLARTRTCRWAIDPAVLSRSIRVDGWCPTELANAAERELLRLHRAELAFLLREATRLRLESSSKMRASDEAGLSLAAWRACFREAVRCASRDGVSASKDLLRLLRGCRTADVDHWPAAAELACAALALHDIGVARLRLGDALLANGRTLEACAAFARAIARGTSENECARALSGLAKARAAAARSSACRGELQRSSK